EALLASRTPFSAALARALLARRTSSLVGSACSPVSFRPRCTRVFTDDRMARLWVRLRNDERTRFFAERVLAMRRLIIDGHAKIPRRPLSVLPPLRGGLGGGGTWGLHGRLDGGEVG